MLMTAANALLGVLSNSAVAGIRTTHDVDIDLTSGTQGCESILQLLEQSAAEMRRYNVERGRLHLIEAAESARQAGNCFLQAAAGAELAMVGTYRSTNASILNFLGKARQLMLDELYLMHEHLMEMRAKPAIAAHLLNPREALLELIEENIHQYHVLARSEHLRQTRERADDALLRRDWALAERLSDVGVKNAIGLFGRTHWWAGMMQTRLASALLGQNKRTEAQPRVVFAQQILLEWALEPETGPFAIELELLRQVANGVGQSTAAGKK